MSDHGGADDGDGQRRCVCDRRLDPGLCLCRRCGTKLAEDLLEIADRHHRLSARPSPQPGRYDRAGSSTPGSKPAARLEVTTLTDLRSGQTDPVLWQGADGKQHREGEHDTPAVLRAVLGWCETVAAERGFTTEPWLPPPFTEPVDELPRFTMADHDEMTGSVDWIAARRAAMLAGSAATQRRREQWSATRIVDAAVDWLNRQDDWIERWPAAGDLAARVKLLRNRLRSACGDPNPRPIGPCVRFVSDSDGGDTECGAPIFLPPPRPGVQPAVRCASRHRHEYDGVDLLRLKLINEGAQG